MNYVILNKYLLRIIMKKLHVLIAVAVSATMSVNAQPGRGYAQDAAEKKYGQPGMDKLEGWMSKVANAKTEETYTFPLSITMHTTSYKDNEKKKEADVKYYISAAQNAVGFKGEEETGKKKKDASFIIYDHKNHSMVMLDEKEKTGMAMNLNAFMSGEAIKKRDEGKTEPVKSDVKCNKTGKTKTILGYKCEEYVCIDEDRNRRNELWITTKFSPGLSKASANNPWGAYFQSAEKLGGMMMEGIFYKNEHIESSMLVTEINEKADVQVKLVDYKMNEMFR